MANFLFGMMIVSFIIGVIGIFSPDLALSFMKSEKRKRIYVVLIFGIITLISLSSYKLTIAKANKDAIRVQEEKVRLDGSIYHNEIHNQVYRIDEYWKNLRELMGDIKEDDDEWIMEFNSTVDGMKGLVEEARALKPPKKYKKVHETYLKAIDGLNTTPQKIGDAIAKKDSEILKEIGRDEKEGLAHLEEAIIMMNQIKKE